ncbi:hypothetical protein D9758_017027 [Tetrapyrgos nigripes]|uniref:F-box domain-containing protein n=1 Tax=Tetrapyrgos nigripes TaxID=182062 RepID=A0A8H5CJB8_9AGAR|nr:hypothetical protein D9758_017027 [Tetrapyrgos nigripes]
MMSLYIRVSSPPTPAPSPPPTPPTATTTSTGTANTTTTATATTSSTTITSTKTADTTTTTKPDLSSILSILPTLPPEDLFKISEALGALIPNSTHRTAVDFLSTLPPELSIYILSFLSDARDVISVGLVCKKWNELSRDEGVWRGLCVGVGFSPHWPYLIPLASSPPKPIRWSWRQHFANEVRVLRNWHQGGHLIRAHRVPFYAEPEPRRPRPSSSSSTHIHSTSTSSSRAFTPSSSTESSSTTGATIITSLTLSSHWVICGLANSRIHVFSAKTGVLHRTLVHRTVYEETGREGTGKNEGRSREGRSGALGVWCLGLIEGWEEAVEDTHGEDLDAGSDSDSKGKGRQRVGKARERETIGGWKWQGTEYPDDPSRMLTPELRVKLGLPPTPLPMSTPIPNSSLPHFPPHSSNSTFNPPTGHDPSFQGLRSTPTHTSISFGNPRALLLSGGCDKTLKLWDVESGACLYTFEGHEGTVRCLNVLHGWEPNGVMGRAIAVSGSRDGTLRVWDLRRGSGVSAERGILRSHPSPSPIRVLDTCGHIVVSGGDDGVVRVWDLGPLISSPSPSSPSGASYPSPFFEATATTTRETGNGHASGEGGEDGMGARTCRHILTGHRFPIYSLAFDGVRIVSGSLDTTVRVWDVLTGTCISILSNHTSLVCQVQLSPGSEMWGNPTSDVPFRSSTSYHTDLEENELGPRVRTGTGRGSRPLPLLATASSNGQVIVYDIRLPSSQSSHPHSTSNPRGYISRNTNAYNNQGYQVIANIHAHDAASVTGLQFVQGPRLEDVFPSTTSSASCRRRGREGYGEEEDTYRDRDGEVDERDEEIETYAPMPMLLTSGNDGGVRLSGLLSSYASSASLSRNGGNTNINYSREVGRGELIAEIGIENDDVKDDGLGPPRDGVWKVATGPCVPSFPSTSHNLRGRGYPWVYADVGYDGADRVDSDSLPEPELDSGDLSMGMGIGTHWGRDRKDICAVMCRRGGKTVMEIWGMGLS